ncbi:hypothetical protein FMGBMHLM_3939 [Methylobacterium aerolatum]|nr:hypothetical protein FMGBMHLM_3939 [Methylobacterium aerolatum]
MVDAPPHRGRAQALLDIGLAADRTRQVVPEGLEGLVVDPPRLALEVADHAVDRVDRRLRVASGDHAVFAARPVHPQGRCVLGEQVDHRRAVQHHMVPGDPHLIREGPRELEGQRHLPPRQRGDGLQAGDVEKQELLGKGEVFLEVAEPREGVARIGDHGLVGAEPHRLHGVRRQRQADARLVPHGDRPQMAREPQQQRPPDGGLPGGVEEEAEAPALKRAQAAPSRRLEGQRQARGGVPALALDLRDRQRQDIDGIAGAEPAGDAVDRAGREGDARRDHDGAPVALVHLREGHDAHGRDRPQVMRPEQPDEPVDEFRHLVFEFLPQLRHGEGEAFEEPLHVRIGRLPGQEARETGIGPGELLAEFTQVGQLVLVEGVERHVPLT